LHDYYENIMWSMLSDNVESNNVIDLLMKFIFILCHSIHFFNSKALTFSFLFIFVSDFFILL